VVFQHMINPPHVSEAPIGAADEAKYPQGGPFAMGGGMGGVKSGVSTIAVRQANSAQPSTSSRLISRFCIVSRP